MRLIYIYVSLLFVSCASAPRDYLTSNSICNYNNSIFKITENEMSFDVNRLKERELILVDNEYFESRIFSHENGVITYKQNNRKLNIGKWINYDKNGRIKSSSFLYLNGTKEIGKETYYNREGEITKVIDHEKGYKICWAEAIEIIKKIAKKDIKKYKINKFNLLRTNLNEFPDANPEWRVSMKGNEEYNERDTKFYVIDGVTGKLNRTYKTRLIYDSLDD